MIEQDKEEELKEFQTVFDEEEEVDDKPRSLFMGIIKQLAAGMDLTRISLPAFVSESRSFLETSANLFSHIDLLLNSIKIDDPVLRMAYIVRFYMSGFHIRSKGVKKPYNPTLGEIFRCFWDHSDGSRTYYIGEQVLHHPPLTCFYCENLTHGLSITGYIRIRSGFKGNSAGTYMIGPFYLNLLKRRETYLCSYPDFYARGVVFGKMRMETCGNTHIQCAQSGLRSDIHFIEKPFFGGAYNQFECRVTKLGASVPLKSNTPIIRIFGDWTSHFFVEDNRNKVQYVYPSSPSSKYVPTPFPADILHDNPPFTLGESVVCDCDNGGTNAGKAAKHEGLQEIEENKQKEIKKHTLPPAKHANSVLFFDVLEIPLHPKQCVTLEKQLEHESRRVWERMTVEMRKKSYEKANDEKYNVEVAARKREKKRRETMSGVRQRYFHYVEDAPSPSSGPYRPIKDRTGHWVYNYALTFADVDAAEKYVLSHVRVLNDGPPTPPTSNLPSSSTPPTTTTTTTSSPSSSLDSAPSFPSSPSLPDSHITPSPRIPFTSPSASSPSPSSTPSSSSSSYPSELVWKYVSAYLHHARPLSCFNIPDSSSILPPPTLTSDHIKYDEDYVCLDYATLEDVFSVWKEKKEGEEKETSVGVGKDEREKEDGLGLRREAFLRSLAECEWPVGAPPAWRDMENAERELELDIAI